MISESMWSLAANSRSRSGVRAREIADHGGSRVASDDATDISTKCYATKIDAGVHQRQHTRSIVLRNGSAAEKYLRVAVHPDSGAESIGARPVSQNMILPVEVGLTLGIDIDACASVVGDLGAVKERDLASKSDRNPDWTVGLDDVVVSSTELPKRNLGVFLEGDSTRWVIAHHVGAKQRAELRRRTTAKVNAESWIHG